MHVDRGHAMASTATPCNAAADDSPRCALSAGVLVHRVRRKVGVVRLKVNRLALLALAARRGAPRAQLLAAGLAGEGCGVQEEAIPALA